MRSPPTRAHATLLLVALSLAACSRGEPSSPAPSSSAPSAPDSSRCVALRLRLTEALAKAPRRAPDALLGVDVPGCPPELLSIGESSYSTVRPFRMASVAKTFLATLALRAVERGSLSLDAPLDRFARELPAVRGTTLRSLLQHTSGLFPYEKDATFGAWQAAPPTPRAPHELVALSLGHTPRARRGAPFRYANTNYVLVARLLELTSGAPLATLVARELTGPEGLTHTAAERGDEALVGPVGPTARLAESAPTHHPSWLFGAGDLVTTLGDLVRWTRRYGTGAVIPATLRAEWLRAVPTDDAEVRYGLGVFVTDGAAAGGFGPVRSHAGDVGGLHLEAVYFLDLDAAIVAVVNQDGGDPEAVVLAAAKAVRGY